MERRSVFRVVVLTTALLFLTACAKPGPTVLGEKDSGRAVEIRVGEQLTVELPANVTTGFQWVVADTGPLTQAGDPVYEEPQKAGVVGAGGSQTFEFEAGAAGSGRLKLEYRRPWEKDVPAEKTWSVTLTVTEP